MREGFANDLLRKAGPVLHLHGTVRIHESRTRSAQMRPK